MTTEDTSPIEVQRNTARERRKDWRKNMSDRTFSLEDPPNADESNISSTSQRQDESSLECRLEHIPIYSWIESNFTVLRVNLIKRGLNEQDINDKEQTIVNNLKVYLQNLIELEGKENELLQSRIRAILDECVHLNRLLKLDHSIDKIENDELSLLEQLKRANDLLEKINQVLKQKLEEINQLRLIEDKLCQKLDEKPIEFNTEGDEEMPYDKRQETLEQHIQDLQNLQNDRSSSIEQARNQIHEMKIELDLDKTYNQPAEDNQVLNLIDGPVHLIELSKTNVQRLVDIAHELNTKYQSNRMRADYLVNTLHALYERLNLTDSDKHIKLPLDKPHRPANLILLEKEIDRCKELRRQNMRIYIENIRDEIFAQYEKCFYGREQMESFLPLYSNEFTEELLDEHEKELEEINMYYMHNEQLFVNLANWHEVWAEYREFQRQASDPDRFKRRGYSAVQEEKQRKHLEFSLKKVQDTILQLSKDYEQEFGHQFLVEGTRHRQQVRQAAGLEGGTVRQRNGGAKAGEQRGGNGAARAGKPREHARRDSLPRCLQQRIALARRHVRGMQRKPVAGHAAEERVALGVPSAGVGGRRWRAQQGAHRYPVARGDFGGVGVAQAQADGAADVGSAIQRGRAERDAPPLRQGLDARDKAADDRRAAWQGGPRRHQDGLNPGAG